MVDGSCYFVVFGEREHSRHLKLPGRQKIGNVPSYFVASLSCELSPLTSLPPTLRVASGFKFLIKVLQVVLM